jgi:hypothetical protein
MGGFAGLLGGIRDAFRRSSQPFVLRPVAAQFGSHVALAGRTRADPVLEPALPTQAGKRRLTDAKDVERITAIDQDGVISLSKLCGGHFPAFRSSRHRFTSDRLKCVALAWLEPGVSGSSL